MSYRQLSSRTGWPCSKAVYKPVRHTSLLSVRWINSWWWTKELSETCRVSYQNKFVQLVHLVGFIIKKPNGKCWMDCLTVEDEGTSPLKEWELLTQWHSSTSEKNLKPWFILLTKIITVYFENYTKHTTVCMAECSTGTCCSRAYMIVTAMI